jgi:hypothetical protein
MRTRSVAAILAALVLPIEAADLTPSGVHALLARADAKSTVETFDPPTWTRLNAHVAAGERGWIDLVPLLAPLADSAHVEALAGALSQALTANPAGVLAVLGEDPFSAEAICRDRAAADTMFEAVAFLDAAALKVAAVLDPDLIAARNACLSTLGDARLAALI